MATPTPDQVRHALASFDTRRQKIVAGMLGVMIKDPSRIRDREWISERLAAMTVMAGEFEADTPDDAVTRVQTFLEQNATELLGACYLLFQRVGLDLEPRASEGFTFDEAIRCGLTYLPSIESSPREDSGAPVPRDLGEQPLAQLMKERDLGPKDLVSASKEQLTHKMVTRAMKGRRLTDNAMGKVLRAWNGASGNAHGAQDLFNYVP